MIQVQHGLSGHPRAWTGSGQWANLIWAGHDLLANDFGAPPAYGSRLAILHGPGQQRTVQVHPGDPGATFTVVALNPQGTTALLDTQLPGGQKTHPASADLATLLRINDNRVLSTVPVSTNDQAAVDALAPDGSWRGREIITTDGYFNGGPGHPAAMLVTLTVHDNRLRLRATKQFAEHGRVPEGQDLNAANQARFLDATGHHVAVWFSSAVGPLEYLACDTHTERCISSHSYRALPAGATFLSNPSRP